MKREVMEPWKYTGDHKRIAGSHAPLNLDSIFWTVIHQDQKSYSFCRTPWIYHMKFSQILAVEPFLILKILSYLAKNSRFHLKLPISQYLLIRNTKCHLNVTTKPLEDGFLLCALFLTLPKWTMSFSKALHSIWADSHLNGRTRTSQTPRGQSKVKRSDNILLVSLTQQNCF